MSHALIVEYSEPRVWYIPHKRRGLQGKKWRRMKKRINRERRSWVKAGCPPVHSKMYYPHVEFSSLVETPTGIEVEMNVVAPGQKAIDYMFSHRDKPSIHTTVDPTEVPSITSYSAGMTFQTLEMDEGLRNLFFGFDPASDGMVVAESTEDGIRIVGEV